MPELREEMYCSEQINIPPAFPYLLRQYAKAAIRSQPMDLLRWSAAYFRCLSLNIPPPVKPRLEYPIPRDHRGITPGWLKALMYQLQNNQTIPFKVLWDRWTGACLEHETLIQILCLGGFTEPNAIPWLRFISLCAGHLTDDLTHTMILVCEILTEEPEGGSAMITIETFLDLYKFLANIDASRPQILKNKYFRDSLLTLWRKKAEEQEAAEEIKEESIVEEQSEEVRSSSASEELASKKEDLKEVISCPSIAEDDYSIDYYMKAIPADEEEEENEEAEREEMREEEATEHVDEAAEQEVAGEETEEALEEKKSLDEDQEGKSIGSKDKAAEEQQGSEKEEHEAEEQKEDDQQEEHEEQVSKKSVEFDERRSEAPAEEQPKEEEAAVTLGDNIEDYESVSTVQEERRIEDVFEDEKTLREDLERLKAMQLEMAGETDEELEKYKCRLIEEMPLTKSQEDAIAHYRQVDDVDIIDKAKSDVTVSTKESVQEEEETEEQKEMKKYEDVYVDVIPGIGPIVPKELIDAVETYMKSSAKIQHGMVMPRNVRHYNCPPLEVLEY